MVGNFSTQRNSNSPRALRQATDQTCPGLLSCICLQTSPNQMYISRKISKIQVRLPLAPMSEVPPTVMKCFSSQISGSLAILPIILVKPCLVKLEISMVMGTSITIPLSSN
ncbi:hypothetical protein Gorai_006509, partial [Gossypium raimondii]|nr:hypothetical protein [Gossypium raimondii]